MRIVHHELYNLYIIEPSAFQLCILNAVYDYMQFRGGGLMASSLRNAMLLFI